MGFPSHSNDTGYLVAIALCYFPTIPLGLVGLGESPGCWAPEPYAPLADDAAEVAAAARRASSSERFSNLALDFVSAFKFPPFRWLFITNALNACYGQMCGALHTRARWQYWVVVPSSPPNSLLCNGTMTSTHARRLRAP